MKIQLDSVSLHRLQKFEEYKLEIERIEDNISEHQMPMR